MGYIEKHLMDNENIVYRAKLHWIVFIIPIVMLLIGALIFFSGDSKFYKILGSIFLVLGVIRGINEFIGYQTDEFAVTNKRVISKTGWIRRNSMEILLNKIEGIAVDQGIIGRIFNYGTIVSTGTGGNKDFFPLISNPLEFRKKVQEQIANL